ncbi:putative sugar epimerase YhfK [Siminovitchia terrae]|uniref:SDR family oxidoreductase n=1 Tax=Siminovitchia terrae TaxID=1914933 RepID=A0A429X6U4_SIMTE|nr:SDR family oxidoreductase [Siminovitchia terrae]RST59146.1 SDR family oxidoreductase [Siminovitchia terrae]GIN94199.1 putative sugar epimerase YhfK [Siminovitchia terrae]
MKVLVVGSNGQIGRHIMNLLKESKDHTGVAMVRKGEQAEAFREKGMEAIVADLENSVKDLAEVMKGYDAVIFTAGSGGHTGADKTLLIDLDGAVKTVEAAEKARVTRFIMVSAFQANNRENWNSKIKHYYAAKHYADRALMQSGLTYTIVRPGGLVNETGTGKVSAGEMTERATVPREDVAKTVVDCLQEAHTYNRSFDLVSGDTPIEEALIRI